MRYILLILITLSFVGCAITRVDKVRKDIINCTTTLIEYGASASEAGSICMKIYSNNDKDSLTKRPYNIKR